MMGHKLGLRLFIEGVEVPCIGVSLNIAPGSPSAAAIQVIATDKVLEFWPRTVVHVFFYDYVEASAFVEGVTDPDAVGGYDAEEYLNTRYKLLFCGEVQGIQFSKDSRSRSAVLQCVDFSNYWDTTYQYNFNGELLSGHYKAAFLGANTNLFTSPLGHGTGTVAALLCAKCVSFPYLEGLLAGVVHVLEAIGGCYYGDTTFKGCNDFCSIAELRLKLLQQVCAAEKDSSTKNLFARKAFNMWMNRSVGSLGQLVTFRGLTQVLLKFIFHECFPNPVARYIPSEKNLKKTKAYSMSIEKDPRTAQLYVDARAMLTVARRAQQHITEALGAAEDAAIPLLSTLQKEFNDLVKYSGRLNRSKARNVVPSVNGLIAQIVAGIKKSSSQICVPGTLWEINVKKVTDSTFNKPAHMAMGEVVAALETLLGLRTNHSKKVTYDKVDRLNNQIFRPDIWFVPPPVCNVLFPESYSQFQWSRNYLREVSRMELQTTNEVLGDDALFNGRYYAPNVTDMRKGVKMESRKFSRFIMQHELFTGIIPMFEKMTEANLFAMKSKQVNIKGSKVGYAQRAVNFQYFKHRFASRQMQAFGRFNPWFVAGFPSLLIDKCMTYDDLAVSGLPLDEQLKYLDIETKKAPTRAEILRLLIPTQYLGHCIGLAHSMSQQGGSTSYSFTEARIHRESSEFLGVDKAVVSKKVGTAKKTGTYAVPGMQEPKEKGRGPRGGLITKVVNVTRQFRGRALPTLTGKPKQAIVGGVVDVDYWFGKSTKGDNSASTEPAPATSMSQLDQYKAYQITEVFTKRIREEVDLPIEEAVRPPWIWDGWHNLKIGETYMQFFGCTSIVDVEKFTAKDIFMSGDLQGKGADSYIAELEAKEGIQWGSQKAEDSESLDSFLDRISGNTSGSKKKSKKTAKKKANKPAKSELSPSPGMNISADRKAQGLALITMDKEKTIEASVDYLVRLYSMLRLMNLDVESFLRNYNWRPVATLVDMLGSANLEITKLPDKTVTTRVRKNGKWITKKKTVEQGYKVDGVEGFHSRAFSDESNLFGLVDAKVTKVLGISVSNQAVAKKLDVRGIRRQAVRDYMQELTNSRGLLG